MASLERITQILASRRELMMGPRSPSSCLLEKSSGLTMTVSTQATCAFTKREGSLYGR